ncbi:uncharacterized protein [Spinacia oleracea]|uniref:Uncharacterized protein isoform X3 n=1 Tax=Spinacia oleracea TaxID=3562 RepID=A0A9R0K3U4_SPIOL|nr:uncharacterized protein LOC110796701 isoform X3 [Spinacia oleracea]
MYLQPNNHMLTFLAIRTFFLFIISGLRLMNLRLLHLTCLNGFVTRHLKHPVPFRRYEPLQEAIMTIEEANLSEEILEETLASVQKRKNELTANHNEDALSQLSDSMNGAENRSPKSSEEVQQAEPEHQPNENSDENQQQSPTAKGIQVTLTNQSSPSINLLLEVASPLPQQAGASFTSLLTAESAAETLHPLRETVFSQSPEQNNSSLSLQQSQFDSSRDGVLNSYSYSNGNLTGINQYPEYNGISTNGYNYPVASLISPNLQLHSFPASFQVPHHPMQFPIQAPNYYQQQVPLGSSGNVSLFSTPQWSNQRTLQQNLTPFVQQNPQWCNQITLQQNPIPFGQNSMQRGNFLNLLSSVSGQNNMYTDSRPPNLQMNHQSMGNQNNMEPSLTLNLHGSFANNYLQAHIEVERPASSSSSCRKRKLPWGEDTSLRLSSYQNEITASSSGSAIPPAPSPRLRHPRYGLYNPAYEQMSLPIDPYIRIFQELLENDNCRRQQGNQ